MKAALQKDRLTINEILRWRACNQPHKLAYRFLRDGETQEEILNYGELELRSQHIAEELISQNITKATQPLGLLLYPPGLEFICGFFGCLHAGVIAVPSSLPRGKRGKERIETIIKTAQVDFILTDSTTYQSLQAAGVVWDGMVRWIITDQLPINPFTSPNEANLCSMERLKENIAFIQYTSGSTSSPKGVMVSHGNIIANQAMIEEGFGHNEETIFLGWLPFFHDMGLIGNILQPMYLGIESTLMSPLSFLQKPMRWLEAISRYRATTSGGPNFAYDLCVTKATKDSELDLSSWKVAFSGSESVHANTLSRFHQTFSSFGFSSHAFYPCYGLAEATLFVSGNSPGNPPIIKNIDKNLLENEGIIQNASSQTEKVSTFVSVGRCWKDQQIRIVDPLTMHHLPHNVQGEIWLSGSNIAKGYWKNNQATEETFKANISGEKGCFLRTGDLGFLDELSQLYITSRLKDLIIIRGRNIIPQDIEIAIIECDPSFNINGCAAFSIIWQEEERLVVVAEIRREFLHHLDVDRSISIIKQTLAQQHTVEAFEILLVKPNSIPKTSSGKVQRAQCRKLYQEGQLELLATRELKEAPHVHTKA